MPLFLASNDVDEKRGDRKGVAIGLGNVAAQQLIIGELKAAEQNLRRRIEICREIKDEFREAVGHQELGRVLAYRGQFAEAERELDVAFEMFGKQQAVQSQSVVSAYRALRALLMGDASAALASARQARAFAEEDARTWYPHERDFIRAEWMIGAAWVALAATGTVGVHGRAPQQTLQDAERHLAEALSRDRAIGMVDIEAAILLEFARLRKAQAGGGGQESGDRQKSLMQESFDFAREALEIAERSEYRLQQAEIHNFLAEWWLERAVGSRQEAEGSRQEAVEALAKAKEHAERAKERAWCDGAPYYYQVAYERAEQIIESLEALQ